MWCILPILFASLQLSLKFASLCNAMISTPCVLCGLTPLIQVVTDPAATQFVGSVGNLSCAPHPPDARRGSVPLTSCLSSVSGHYSQTKAACQATLVAPRASVAPDARQRQDSRNDTQGVSRTTKPLTRSMRSQVGRRRQHRLLVRSEGGPRRNLDDPGPCREHLPTTPLT